MRGVAFAYSRAHFEPTTRLRDESYVHIRVRHCGLIAALICSSYLVGLLMLGVAGNPFMIHQGELEPCDGGAENATHTLLRH